jgi:hypothetical protein
MKDKVVILHRDVYDASQDVHVTMQMVPDNVVYFDAQPRSKSKGQWRIEKATTPKGRVVQLTEDEADCCFFLVLGGK